jgi:hypothetical protein
VSVASAAGALQHKKFVYIFHAILSMELFIVPMLVALTPPRVST